MTGRSTSTISDVIRSFGQAIFICVKMKQLKIFLKILKNIHIVMNIPIHVGKFSPGVSIDIKEFYGSHISKNVVCSPRYHYTWPSVHINLKLIGWELNSSNAVYYEYAYYIYLAIPIVLAIWVRKSLSNGNQNISIIVNYTDSLDHSM